MSLEDMLGAEYLHLQKVIEDFDTRMLTVKAWSVTFSATAIGFAYDKKRSEVLVVSIISAIAFWIVEGLMKVNRQAYYRRIGEIESHFSEEESFKPYQIGRAWKASFDKEGQYRFTFTVMSWPHVYMPHLVVALVAVGLLLLSPP